VSGFSPSTPATVYGAFRRTVGAWPANEFLCVLPDTAGRYGIAARSYSYAEAWEEVESLKSRYSAAGFGHGHRAGLLLENRPAFFFHWLALNALGVSVVPINSEWRSAELEYLIQHSEIVVAVATAERVAELTRSAANAERPLVVVTPDLTDLRESPSIAPLPQENVGLDTECALLYTSGTTGRPKGCVQANEYYLWAGTWYAQVGGLCSLTPGTERLITPLPMSHMNAMACSTMAMLLTGGCVIPLDRFHPSSWWDSVRDSRATVVHYLGVMPAMLLGAVASARDREHSVRFGFGAGVSSRLHAAFEERFGFPLLEAWAMTETGAGAVVIASREPRKVGTSCFGRPQSEVECRVVDERGEPVAAGQPGELLVRHAGAQLRFGFFREYLKDPEATAQAWQGGYFHTGDIVQVDEDGDFHFVDRKKNVIRRSGENISAVEVESVLLQHPEIAGVGVTAVPDDVRGDEVIACVVPRRPVTSAEQAVFAGELVDFCLDRLAYFKAPGYVAICERLPLTPTEKIQRAALKELALALRASPACVDTRALKKRTPVA
jgi:acyl-CoA synthetase (AMP-forming)/AMP-acid ligase II